MGRWAVEIYLPRFTLGSSFDLAGTLSGMGMPDAFDGAADFSGIDGTKQLSISHVLHNAWGEVDEEGATAAAATVVTVVGTVVDPPLVPPVFRADHPFLFFIRDTQTGSILFLGRVTDPTQ
jgi:serpin B